MSLLKDGKIIEDIWIFIDDDADIPVHGNIVVSFERLKSSIETLDACSGNLGVRLNNDADAHALAPYIEKLALIALHFPAFTDGRAYSQARIITSQLKYTGELRATGNVLVDQAVFMSRCGFDAFEIDERHPASHWSNITHSMSLAYQQGYRTRAGFSPRPVLTSRAKSQATGG
jgi:uncharacterized protein (DUF934 family)